MRMRITEAPAPAPGRATISLGFCLLSVAGTLLAEPSRAHAQQVRSKSSEEKTSAFLRPPGTTEDRYAEDVDWSRIPSWGQTSFFGVRVKGRVFVYVVDASGSMSDGSRLVRAKSELRRSISAMRWPQQFLVIFFNDGALSQPGGVPQTTAENTRSQLFRWFQTIDALGGTDPRPALSRAFGMQPDGIFLLSDGLFPEGTVEWIARSNPNRIPVHCIDMTGGAAGGDLRAIAEGSGGQFATRP